MATLQLLAYETSLAALRAQEEELNRLRTHTGTLLAAGSLAASFLGAQTLSRPGTGPWSTLAIVAFVFSILPCVYLLVPKRGLVFSLSGPVLYQEFSETGQTLDDVHAAVAVWLQTYHEANQKKIDKLEPLFRRCQRRPRGRDRPFRARPTSYNLTMAIPQDSSAGSHPPKEAPPKAAPAPPPGLGLPETGGGLGILNK